VQQVGQDLRQKGDSAANNFVQGQQLFFFQNMHLEERGDTRPEIEPASGAALILVQAYVKESLGSEYLKGMSSNDPSTNHLIISNIQTNKVILPGRRQNDCIK
jgi:hypothetical protein